MSEFIKAEQLYRMKLGDRIAPSNNCTMLRVPGGWVWTDMQGNCFIPWDNEFQPKEGK